MRILIADDTAESRELLIKIISSQPDRQIVVTKDGAEAWWYLSDAGERFDLGIFDITMPVIDGIKLLARVRREPRLSALPVILCTGNTDRQTVAGAASLRVTSYLVKPFSPSALLNQLNAVEARLLAE